MMNLFSRILTTCIFVVLVGLVSVSAGDNDWRPVTPAELAMTTPRVEPGADAEAIFWEVRVNDATQNVVEEHYVRIKIFTENGREKYSKIDIPYLRGAKIKNVRARVIRPDGSIIELDKKDVFEREILKSNDVKVKAVSFAVPNIEPGVILEYQYQELTRNAGVGTMPVYFQRDIPIQEIKFYIKPYAQTNMKWMAFNAEGSKFVKDRGGFFVASMTNVPALRDEPYMPPIDQVRSWLLVYADNSRSTSAEEYWARFAGRRSAWYKSFQPKGDVKAILPEIIGDAATPEEKLSRIFRFCKTQLHNITYDPSLSADERAEISDDIDNARDVLKEKRGNSAEINTLFGALATAAGFESRFVFTGNRSKLFFKPSQAHSRFIHLSMIAVDTGSGWRFYSPGDYFTPEGMLTWHDEGENALLIGKDNYIWAKTPLSGPVKTIAKRNGQFKLLEDGTLEGTVKVEFTGHLSERFKLINYDESESKRAARLRTGLRSRMSEAELSEISVENANDPEKPFNYSYKVRVPNYAQRTGKRLFLKPGFFEYGVNPVFSASERKYDIYFSYPWQELDNISIQLPAGFSLDSPDSPAEVADPGKIGSVKISMGMNKATGTLYYKREFSFGGDGKILFDAVYYGALKNLFDGFHAADSHVITIRQDEAL